MKTKEVKLSNDKLSLSRLYDRFGVLVVFVLLFAVSCMLSDRFLQTSNLFNILRQISMFGILSVGMTFVIVSGGIDLSVGSIIALVCVITANMVNDHGIIPAILVALLAGALVGLINGVGIAYGKLQPFIMTLGTMYMASGAASMRAARLSQQPSSQPSDGCTAEAIRLRSSFTNPVSFSGCKASTRPEAHSTATYDRMSSRPSTRLTPRMPERGSSRRRENRPLSIRSLPSEVSVYTVCTVRSTVMAASIIIARPTRPDGMLWCMSAQRPARANTVTTAKSRTPARL